MGYIGLMCLGGQATLDEILTYFHCYDVYAIDINKVTELIIVAKKNGNVVATFETIGYEDDDCTPDVYELYDTNYDNVKIAEVAHLWGGTITKLQGGTK